MFESILFSETKVEKKSKY